MKRIFAKLYRIDDPFRGGKKYTYLLLREQGNLLLCHFKPPSSVGDHFDEIERLGGIDTQLVTHHHEAAAVHDEVHARFGCKLRYHHAERKSLRRKTKCPSETFDDAGLQLGDDFHALYFPGDTRGTAIYRWRYRGRYLLFSGHVIYPIDDGWDITFNARAMPHLSADQFAHIPELRMDYLFPCRTSPGEEEYHRFDDDTRRSFSAAFSEKLSIRPSG